MSEAPRICDYRECDVDLDAIKKRKNARYCHTDHKSAEHNARKHDPPGTSYPIQKPCKSVYSPRSGRNRRGSGTRIYVRDAAEARYLRAALRGGKRPRLDPRKRQGLIERAGGAVERLAA